MVLDASPPPALLDVPGRVDGVLRRTIATGRAELAGLDPGAAEPADEIRRLLDAGGKRVRPGFCYWGYRAAGGLDAGAEDEPIVRAAAALELLHTMALIHDDVMDGAAERRGVPTVQVRQAARAAARGDRDADHAGVSIAILAGDLAAVLADGLLLESGFGADRLTAALTRYHRMRLEMAAGQFLDLAGADVDPQRLAELKGGTYTVGWPLAIGAALAGASEDVDAALARFAAPLGRAFQLADDIRDGDARPGVARDDVGRLVGEARRSLASAPIDPVAAAALDAMAAGIG